MKSADGRSAFGVDHGLVSKAGPKTVASAARFWSRMARRPVTPTTTYKKKRAEDILTRNAAKVGRKRRLP